jgi:hypothetical protein
VWRIAGAGSAASSGPPAGDEPVRCALKTLELKTADDKDLVPRFQRVKNPSTYIGVWLFGKGSPRAAVHTQAHRVRFNDGASGAGEPGLLHR